MKSRKKVKKYDNLPPCKEYYRFMQPFTLEKYKLSLLTTEFKEQQETHNRESVQTVIEQLKQEQMRFEDLAKTIPDPKQHPHYPVFLKISKRVAALQRNVNYPEDVSELEVKLESDYQPPALEDVEEPIHKHVTSTYRKLIKELSIDPTVAFILKQPLLAESALPMHQQVIPKTESEYVPPSIEDVLGKNRREKQIAELRGKIEKEKKEEKNIAYRVLEIFGTIRV